MNTFYLQTKFNISNLLAQINSTCFVLVVLVIIVINGKWPEGLLREKI